MKNLKLIFILFAFIFINTCKENSEKKEDQIKSEVQKEDTQEVIKKVTVILEPKSESNASGNAVFTEENGTVTMVVKISGLDEGEHAIHLHEKADCSSPDGKSTGGHWNPTAQPHGKWGATEGYHKGDIGNFMVDANGDGSITFKTDQWCIGCGDPTKDILGKAIIIHKGYDDFVTQPTGAAGGRISCGGIIE